MLRLLSFTDAGASFLWGSFYRTSPEVQYKMGLLFIELQNFELARIAFKEVLAVMPDNQKAREYLDSLEDRMRGRQ